MRDDGPSRSMSGPRQDARVDDDWDDSVSMRLAALALDRGRLTDDLVTALAVRGTLLVDLALRGRVRDTEVAVEFDDPPTGFPPAPGDLAAEHLRRGSWTVRRRAGPCRARSASPTAPPG